MRKPPLTAAFTIGLAATVPQTALAASVALAPILGPDARLASALTTLAASELEFMPGLDEVIELREAPPSLTSACLTSAPCLSGIGKANRADKVVAGQVSGPKGALELDIVLFDVKSNKAVARRKFPIPSSADDAADVMPDIVQDLFAGTNKAATPVPPKPSPAPQAALPSLPSPEPASEPEDLDELDFADGDEAPAAPAPKPAPKPVPPPPTAKAAPAVEKAPPPPKPAPKPEPEDDFDPDAISFGSSSSEMSVVEVGVPKADPVPEKAAPPIVEPKPAPRAAAPPKAPKPPPMAKEKAVKPIKASTQPTNVQIRLRGGYSRFQRLGFLSGGAEGAVRLVAGLHIVGGIEAYAVERTIPELLQRDGIPTEWNLLYPANAGFLYKFGNGKVLPYVGADAIIGSYYIDETSTSVAVGGRGRTGLDVMFTRNIGLNLNLAAGVWTGDRWSWIESGMTNAGFLAQGSGGLVVAF